MALNSSPDQINHYLNSMQSHYPLDKNNFSQRALAQKAFKRAVEYLIRDTNGYWFVSNDLKDKGVLNGYEFKNLGSNGSFTEKTTVRFLLSRKDIFYSKF